MSSSAKQLFHAAVPMRLSDVRLDPDGTRTALRPFEPGEPPEAFRHPEPRAPRIVARAMGFDAATLAAELARTVGPLRKEHREPEAVLLARYAEIAANVPAARDADEAQRLLIGAYFTQEFAFESAALFNPSVVEHPDQAGVADGDVRIVLSLRGVGEGHVSSLTFRVGMWADNGAVTVEPPSRYASGPTIAERTLPNDRRAFDLTFEHARELSERVIYPFLPIQGRGVEDVRLVTFTDDDGRATVRGTFTAFNGSDVRQAMLQTDDFAVFETRGVEGALYAGKGMALFPRRVGGRYAMLSRQDNENIFLTYSDNLHEWDGGQILLQPEQPWESVQLGNCGSPIEIDEGFLMLTHGVGGVRGYSLGVALLDKDDPSRVIARLEQPLIAPGTERDGYVPNVIYSCGGLARGRELLLPFAVADTFARFATLSIDDLIPAMERR